MDPNCHFNEFFGNTPIIGMIHLAGDEPVKRALDELDIFEAEGINGAIIENYHGSIADVEATLGEARKTERNVILGINVLPNEFEVSFHISGEYGADFIQLDHVAGRYRTRDWLGSVYLNESTYSYFRKKNPDVLVMGGVWPKYYQPILGSDLEYDLKTGMQRAEAIVVTGAGTGCETPLAKINQFRKILNGHPLVVGAGLTAENAQEQLLLADGAIVGSYLKEGNDTSKPVDRAKVKSLMDVVKKIREYKKTNSIYLSD